MKPTTARKLFFDRHADAWCDKNDVDFRNTVSKILNKAIPAIRPPVLDVGSGAGVLLPIIADVLYTKGVIVELDLSLRMLQKGREVPCNTAVEYCQGDATHLPFAAAKFNTLISFASFAHFVDKKHVIQEFYRVLHPGGTLLILHLHGHHQLNKLHRSIGEAVKYDTLPSIGDLSSDLKNTGFKNVIGKEEKNLYLVLSEK
jgi:ubiquinone/menaquinone biosynthesis C-methylase UbiE